MKKHFVDFFSPGTFFSETSRFEIDLWDVNKAVEMARTINERYNATPYGFRFVTRERDETDFDSKETAHSGMYYLGGKIMSLAEVKAKNDPKDKILISNMENNGYHSIIVNENSWRITLPFKDDDTLVPFTK